MHAKPSGSDLRVLIVAEHASFKFGGEASLPLHYFRCLRRRGIECWMLLHARTRSELEQVLGPDLDRVVFVSDSRLQVLVWKLHRITPYRLHGFTVFWLVRMLTQRQQRRIAARMVREHNITVVHEPIPVSPRMPSMLSDVGAPVIIGPMNGDMSFPPGFPHLDHKRDKRLIALGRTVARWMHRIMPGKRRAAMLLVANERSRRALPEGLCPNVRTFPENGVDLDLWTLPDRPKSADGPPVFCYMGRLIALKACDLMLRALARLPRELPAKIVLIGDGPERQRLQELTQELGLQHRVEFRGWLSQRDCAGVLAQCDALILPSLHECGGAVVLEAMAAGLPVIAADWGGPADYVDESCGILVPPRGPEEFTTGLAAAMERLAHSPQLRQAMGRAGRAKVEREFAWDRRIDTMIAFYREVSRTPAPAEPTREVRLDLQAAERETAAAAR